MGGNLTHKTGYFGAFTMIQLCFGKKPLLMVLPFIMLLSHCNNYQQRFILGSVENEHNIMIIYHNTLKSGMIRCMKWIYNTDNLFVVQR